MQDACFCEASEEAGRIYCCDGLIAWSEARYSEAWEAAQRSLAADPSHGPSWLLYAYARYKQGHREEALGLMETLADDPDVGRRARRALRTNAHRRDRDQVHVSGGAEVGPGAGPLLMIDVPVGGPWGVRLDVRYLTWREHDFAGSVGGLAATWSGTAGVWRIQLTVGGQGALDDETLERMRPGAFAGARFDVRVVQVFGLGVEGGGGVQGTSFGAEAYPYGRFFATFYAPARKTW